jgi:hypothetical protein
MATLNINQPIVRTHIRQNIELFYTDWKLFGSKALDVLSYDLPELTATKNKTYPLVKLVNRSDIGAGNVLVKPTTEQLLQVGRAIAQLSLWQYDKQDNGFHILSHKDGKRQIRVTLRRGEHGESHYAEELVDGNWVMSRATSGLIAKQSGNTWWVFGDVYRHFNRLRGGSWDNESRQIEWYADVPEAERGKWHKHLTAFSFNGTLPARVLEAVQNSSEWTKYHIVALFLLGRGVRVHMTGSELSEAQVWEQIHTGYIYEMWRLAGFDWDKRPARTSTPLSVTAEDVAAIREWEAFEATIQHNEELGAEYDEYRNEVCSREAELNEEDELAAINFTPSLLGLFN